MHRLGLVGFGAWGSKYLNAVRDSGKASISIICRRNLSMFDPLITNLYAVTDSFNQLVDSKPDGIILACGPGAHVPYAKWCIENRVPFMVEKPLALQKSDADAILKLARSNRFWFQINHIHLFAPAYLKFRAIVRGWRASRIMIYSRGFNHGPFREYDSYLDYSPHDISMIFGLYEPRELEDVGVHVERNPRTKGELFRLTMSSPHFHSHTWVGNGALEKRREILAINKDNGDQVLYYNDPISPRWHVLLNSVPQDFSSVTPLVSTVQSFCTMIDGDIDWRYHFDFYDRIYKTVCMPL